MNLKVKRLGVFIVVFAMICSLVSTASATSYGVSIGSSTHNYTTTWPLHFYLYGSVYYSKLTSTEMTIDRMTQTVTNYADSKAALRCPEFQAQTPTAMHSSKAMYQSIAAEIPSSGSQSTTVYTSCDWTSLLNTLYPGSSTTYRIPSSPNEQYPTDMLMTLIGISADNNLGVDLSYNYSAYWNGDGTVIIYDGVQKEGNPIRTTKRVTTTAGTASFSMTLDDPSGELILSNTEILANEKAVGIVSAPIVASDPQYEDCFELNGSDITLNEDGTVYVNVNGDADINQLYVKTPSIIKQTEVRNTDLLQGSLFELAEVIDEEDQIKLLVFTYEGDSLGMYPDDMILHTADGDISSLTSQVFYDENGTELGGRIVFGVPLDYELSASYSLGAVTEIVRSQQEDIVIPLD